MSPAFPAPAATPPLTLLFWELTARCNLRCAHCRRQAAPALDSADRWSAAAALAFLEQIAACGRPLLVFSGGEPLLRPDWEALAERAGELQLPCALATNGTLLDEALADRVAAAGFRRVSISLDGATPEVHDALRGESGAWARALNGLRALKVRGVAVQINFSLTRDNVAQAPAVLDLALREGATALHFFILVPVGCGREMEREKQLDGQAVESFLIWLADQTLHSPLQLKATCAPMFARVARQRGALPAPARAAPALPFPSGCLAGLGVCFVSHAGQVFPCGYLPLETGNVFEKPLREIWEASPVLLSLRTGKLRGKCGRCEYRKICLGCRARAYSLGGDLLGEDEYCAHEPPAAKERRDA